MGAAPRHRRRGCRRPLPSRRAEVRFTRALPGRFATVSPEKGTRELASDEKQGELKGGKCLLKAGSQPLDPKLPLAHGVLGKALLAQGRFSEAREPRQGRGAAHHRVVTRTGSRLPGHFLRSLHLRGPDTTPENPGFQGNYEVVSGPLTTEEANGFLPGNPANRRPHPCNDQEKVLAFPYQSPLRRCPGLFSYARSLPTRPQSGQRHGCERSAFSPDADIDYLGSHPAVTDYAEVRSRRHHQRMAQEGEPQSGCAIDDRRMGLPIYDRRLEWFRNACCD